MYLKSTRNLKNTRQLLIAVIIIGKVEKKTLPVATQSGENVSAVNREQLTP